jgi:hypothetical protein
LTAIPSTIGQLTALTALYVSVSGGQQRSHLQAAMAFRDLYNNQLTAIPSTIGQLTALTYLYVSVSGVAAALSPAFKGLAQQSIDRATVRHWAIDESHYMVIRFRSDNRSI